MNEKVEHYSIIFNEHMDNLSLIQNEKESYLQFNFGNGKLLKLHIKQYDVGYIKALIPLLNMSISKIELV